MKHILLAATLALAACANAPGEVEALAFCDSFANAVNRAAYMRANGLMDAEQVQAADTVISTIAPFCLDPVPGQTVPTTALDAMDRLLLILATKGG